MTEENNQPSARYPSDLNDDEWKILGAIFDQLEPYKTGLPRKSDRREILNAIFSSIKLDVHGVTYQKFSGL